MWFTLLAPFLTGIFGKDGIIGTYIATKQAIQQKELDAKYQLAVANVELIKQQGSDAVQSEKNKLDATSQGFKFVTFVLINIPVIIICFSPSKGKDIFENFALIPVWYAQLYAAIYGIIWGLPVAASAMASIFGAIQQAWANRQDKKIEKIQALGEANGLNLDQAKKQIFDIMRKTTGTLSQPQVDAANPIIDQAFSLAQQALSNNSNAPVTVNTGDK